MIDAELARGIVAIAKVLCPRKTVTEAEIAELHPQIPEWQIVEREGIKRLERMFKFENFVQALALHVLQQNPPRDSLR